MDSAPDTIQKTFNDHVSELRVRLVWIVLAVGLAAGAAFTVNQQLLAIIQKPLHQTLYFTSPGGGLSFIFQLCVTVGVIAAFPVIAYHLYQFVSPLLAHQKRFIICLYAMTSFVLASSGIAFAYFISLPAALHFLTQFGGEGIKSLINADAYFSFALTYIAGFAIIFQIPLLVLLINKIKPLGPGSMMRYQRWVILLSFIGAALITPTPDPINQALMAAPAIVLYQVSILLVIVINHGKQSIFAQTPAVVSPHITNMAALAIAAESVASSRNIASNTVGSKQPRPRRYKNIDGILRRRPLTV